jgi:PAS domain S-box-containing protein
MSGGYIMTSVTSTGQVLFCFRSASCYHAANNRSLPRSEKHFTRGALHVAAKTAPELEVLGIPFAKNMHPMYVFDRETLAFLEVNESAVQIYGYSREEFLGMKITEIRPPEEVAELLRQIRSPRPKTGATMRHRSSDGAVFKVSITSWELTFHGRAAEMVLARREAS